MGISGEVAVRGPIAGGLRPIRRKKRIASLDDRVVRTSAGSKSVNCDRATTRPAPTNCHRFTVCLPALQVDRVARCVGTPRDVCYGVEGPRRATRRCAVGGLPVAVERHAGVVHVIGGRESWKRE